MEYQRNRQDHFHAFRQYSWAGILGPAIEDATRGSEESLAAYTRKFMAHAPSAAGK